MIYVICANDSLEEASFNDLPATKARLEELAAKHYAQTLAYGSRQTYLEYRKQVYWHIHEVKEIGKEVIQNDLQASKMEDPSQR